MGVWRVVDKHQKVEVKLYREVNNRNPPDLLCPLGFLSLSEHTGEPYWCLNQ